MRSPNRKMWVVSVPFCQFEAALTSFRTAPDAYEVVCGPNDRLEPVSGEPGRLPSVTPVRCSLEPDSAVLLALNHLLGEEGRSTRVTIFFQNGECEDVHGNRQRLAAKVEQQGGVENYLPAQGGVAQLLSAR